MKLTKRIISIILMFALLTGIVPTKAQAEGVQSSTQNVSTTVEGTNSFGSLLSEEIEEQQESEEEYSSAGYNVTGLTIENGIALVEYDSLEKAVLVVSLYTEDGLQLLLSNNTVVTPEDTSAVITLEGEIPEYFMASAYLLNTYDYSPLCPSYDTPMYTKEMQELLASTTDDYDADKVLNLDDDITTNFAVYADTTIVLEYTEDVNTVISADDETATYVIGNADSNITELQEGDVLAYSYGENHVLIVKVSALTVDGTTATITGAELDLEEVFSHVKIESDGNTEDITVDETSGDDGVSFIGMVSSESEPTLRTNPYGTNTVEDEAGVSGKLSLGFQLEKESGSVKLTGSLSLDTEVEFSYYISTTRQYVEFKADIDTVVSIAVSGKSSFPVIKLPAMGISPVPGVYIGFEPEIAFIISAKIDASFHVSRTIGYSYENGVGINDLSTSPKVEIALDVEGSVFFGLDMAPTVGILNGWIAKIKLSALSGIEMKGEMEGTNYDDALVIGNSENPDSIHNCESCLAIELYLKAEFKIELQFLKVVEISFKLAEKNIPIGECYYSFDQQGFGLGPCPNKSYRVTVYVQNAQGVDAFGTDVVADWAEQLTEIPMGTTNSNGVVVDYLKAGTYTFTAIVDGEKLEKTITVEEACKVVLSKNSIGNNPEFIFGTVNPEDITDYGAIKASGECGANGDNLTWTEYDSGLLIIDGVGEMKDYSYRWPAGCSYPWSEWIQYVIIRDGVTCIGTQAFRGMDYLESIVIPPSIVHIKDDAFYGSLNIHAVYISDLKAWCEIEFEDSLFHCSTSPKGSLFVDGMLVENLVIPDGITSIKARTFAGCTSLKSVRLPEGITYIGASAFNSCENLTEINVPDGVTSIGSSAFYRCTSLSSISLPDSLIEIGRQAFRESGLVHITIPDSVTSIEWYTFVDCEELTSIIIPEGVISIGESAFSGCTNLTNISLPSHLTTINEGTFNDCSRLTKIKIPDGVTNIGANAFRSCKRLAEVVIPDSVTNIGGDAFCGCGSLTAVYINDIGYWCNIIFGGVYANPLSCAQNLFVDCVRVRDIVIPDGVTRITAYAFSDYNGLTGRRIVIPDSVTDIGDFAFYDCSPRPIIFKGDAPSFGSRTFFYGLPTIYYPANNGTWTTDVLQNYGGSVKWIPYTLDENGEMIVDATATTVTSVLDEVQDNSETDTEDVDSGISMRSIWGGEYETEVTDTYTLKRAFFTGLVPGEEYLLLALASIEVEELLVPENLLYIEQGVAAEDGTLVFTYVQRETTDTSYVMACGASHNDIKDAVITFPEMTAGTETQTVEPTVIYDDKILVEGLDYVIFGTVDYTVAGEYTCHIRGIYNYTGVIECTYTVKAAEPNATLNVYRANVRLQELMKMGFYFTMDTDETVLEIGAIVWTAEEYANETAFDINFTNGTKYLAATHTNSDGSYYYSVETNGIPAQGIDTLLYIIPYVKTESGYAYGTAKSNSILNVCKYQYQNDTDEVKEIIADVLNYATAARNYFVAKGELEAPAEAFNAILSESDKVLAWSEELYAPRANVNETTSEYAPTAYQIYVYIQDALKIEFVFADTSVTGMMYWNGTDYTDHDIHDGATKTGEAIITMQGQYVVGAIEGINAYNIYEDYYIRGYNANGDLSRTYTTSIAAYLTYMIQSNSNPANAETEALVELCKAMMIYGKNAMENDSVNKN